ncbi:sodium:calcium antiporter [bacterium]|nr:MAG: sodium:calcium antiporter [bacterium]
MFLNILILIGIFLLLAFASDLVVQKFRFLSSILNIPLFIFGVLLGMITTLPELFVGLSAINDGIAAVSLGNLFGGIIILFGLVIPVNLLMNSEIKTSGSLKTLLPKSFLILFPMILGLDGKLATRDGIAIILLYIVLMIYLYFVKYNHDQHIEVENVNPRKVGEAILITIFSITIIAVSSHFVVQIASQILAETALDTFVVGSIFFAIFTNLPELIVSFTAVKRKSDKLSTNYITGSALASTLVVGLLAIIHPISFEITPAYYLTAFTMMILLVMYNYFFSTDRKLDRKEGMVLMIIYTVYVVASFIIK